MSVFLLCFISECLPLCVQIAFYGLGLNSSIVLTTIGFGTSPQSGSLGVYQSLHNVSVGNIILSVGGLIPGYWAAFLLIDSWGRKPIQLMGFIVLTVLFVIMGKRSPPAPAHVNFLTGLTILRLWL
jgi:hypothetical protein